MKRSRMGEFMARYGIRWSLPVGLFVWLVYKVVSRFVTISDAVAIPMMIVSVLLMLIGIVYHGWCFGNGMNPYRPNGIKKFKDNE